MRRSKRTYRNWTYCLPELELCTLYACRRRDPCSISSRKKCDYTCSASGPNSRNVRVTRSTFSKNPLAVSRANLTVEVLNVLITVSMSTNQIGYGHNIRDQDVILCSEGPLHGMWLQLGIDIDHSLCNLCMPGRSKGNSDITREASDWYPLARGRRSHRMPTVLGHDDGRSQRALETNTAGKVFRKIFN
jgi:hypothetical protein